MSILVLQSSELVVLLDLSSWCLVMVERLFLAVPWGCLWFVIVVFPANTHLLFLFSSRFCYTVHTFIIGVAPITQLRTCVIK